VPLVGLRAWFDCSRIVPSSRLSTLTSRLRNSIGLKGVCITLSNGASPGILGLP
jgi:hypothetical protein